MNSYRNSNVTRNGYMISVKFLQYLGSRHVYNEMDLCRHLFVWMKTGICNNQGVLVRDGFEDQAIAIHGNR